MAPILRVKRPWTLTWKRSERSTTTWRSVGPRGMPSKRPTQAWTHERRQVDARSAQAWDDGAVHDELYPSTAFQWRDVSYIHVGACRTRMRLFWPTDSAVEPTDAAMGPTNADSADAEESWGPWHRTGPDIMVDDGVRIYFGYIKPRNPLRRILRYLQRIPLIRSARGDHVGSRGCMRQPPAYTAKRPGLSWARLPTRAR